MKHPYALGFVVCWLIAFLVLPIEPGATTLGAYVSHAAAAVGGALVLWLPSAGIAWLALRMRRKT